MYSLDQLIRGVKEPELAKSEIARQWQKIPARFPYDIAVQGSYWTTNIGDRAIGEIFKEELSAEGYRTRIFSKEITSCHASVCILGGGGVIHDWYGVDKLQNRLEFLSNNGMIVGVGVPGIRSQNARELVKSKLSEVDLITVRDDRSREQLESFYNGDIYTTACPTFLHDAPDTHVLDKTGVNFRPWFNLEKDVLSYYFDYETSINPEKAKKEYIKNIHNICDSVKDPVFIPFHKNDEKFANKYLDIEILPFDYSVSKTLKRINSVKKMVTMRYHSLVFSLICDKPVMAISYDPKVSELADRVDISTYRPHSNINMQFEYGSNIQSLVSQAEENFELINANIGHINF